MFLKIITNVKLLQFLKVDNNFNTVLLYFVRFFQKINNIKIYNFQKTV